MRVTTRRWCKLALAALAVAAPAASVEAQAGWELLNQAMVLETGNGQVTHLHFREGGKVVAVFGGQKVVGDWRVADREAICFFWSRNAQECWPYTRVFSPGVPVVLQSDRGNHVRVTLTGSGGSAPAIAMPAPPLNTAPAPNAVNEACRRFPNLC